MSAEADQTPYPSALRAWTTVGVLVFAVLLAYLDRQVLALLVDPIRTDLALSDLQIGLLQGPAFALFYAAAALPLGGLVDRWRRREILTAGVLVWCAATVLCGLSNNFSMLFVARIGVAVGEACLIPGVLSVLGDSFAPRRKPAAFAVYMVVVLVGSSLTIAVAGSGIAALEAAEFHLGTVDAIWRLVFFAAALPGPLAALAIWALGEPARRAAAGEDVSVGIAPERLGLLLWLVPGLALASVAFQMCLAWLPTVLVRDHGWSSGAAGQALGLLVAAASLLVGLAAAFSPGWLRHDLPRLAGWSALVMLCGAPLALGLGGAEGGLVILAGTLAAAAGLFGYSLAPVLTQAATPNRYWGRAAAAFKLVESVVIAGGAVVIGAASDILGPGGLAHALAATVGLALVVGAVLLTRAAAAGRRLSARAAPQSP